MLVVASAGSLALWNDAATVDAGAVASGEMTITATDGAWASAIILWVPGNTSTYTFTVASTTPSAPTTLTIPVTVTVDLPGGSVTDLIAQNESVDLSSLSFTLTQP